MENGVELTAIERTSQILDEEIKIFKIDFKDRLSIMWGWFWRSLILTIIVMLIGAAAGGILGFIIGIIMVFNGADVQEHQLFIQLIGGLIGFCIGFLSIAYYINWITKTNIGKYRFLMVKKI